MHANVMYKRNLHRHHILIYHYTRLYTCLFSSFASRALIVQFEQLTHILLCITLSKLTLRIWIWDYTTMKNKNDPKPWRINPNYYLWKKWKYLFSRSLTLSGCCKKHTQKNNNTWCSSGMHWWLSIRTEKISPNESHQSLHEQYVGFQVEKKKKSCLIFLL